MHNPALEFWDPRLGTLKGEKAKDMWRMLCANAKNFKLEFSDVVVTGDTAKAHGEARHTFSRTGRNVHNIIDVSFKLKDGYIIKHHDHFDLWRWAKQALGFQGCFLGSTKFFQNKLQEQTNGLLAKYQAAEQKKRK